MYIFRVKICVILSYTFPSYGLISNHLFVGSDDKIRKERRKHSTFMNSFTSAIPMACIKIHVNNEAAMKF